MQRRSYHQRARISNAALLKPPAEAPSFNSIRFVSVDRQPGAPVKRIFIVKQAIQLPPTSSAEGRSVQHILIFDDHPESLRLVFGRASAEIDLPRPSGAPLWPLVLLSIVVIGSLIAILWPLF
jgi:hypothetical protein